MGQVGKALGHRPEVDFREINSEEKLDDERKKGKRKRGFSHG